MAKRNHKEWVLNELKEDRFKASYRNCLIHFSIIESLLIDETKNVSDKYSTCIRVLRYTSKITHNDFSILNKLGKKRNKLVHRIIRDKLDQENIDTTIKELMSLIISTYKEVELIKKRLKEDYNFDVSVK